MPKTSMDNKDGNGFLTGLKSFKELGYDVHFQVLEGERLWGAQHRERVWVIGFREYFQRDYTPLAQ